MVGKRASRLGMWSEEAESLADRIGSNCCRSSNLAYSLATSLREEATRLGSIYKDENGTEH